jgi:histidine triad (HIT) family protein
VFCRIVAGGIAAARLYEDADVLAFRDAQPVAPAHALVVPKEHIATLEDARDDHQALLGRMLWVARRVAGELRLSEAGYRLVMNVRAGAGQSVYHVHLHVLGGRPFTWPPG